MKSNSTFSRKDPFLPANHTFSSTTQRPPPSAFSPVLSIIHYIHIHLLISFPVLIVRQQRCPLLILTDNLSPGKRIAAEKAWEPNSQGEQEQQASNRKSEDPLELQEMRLSKELADAGSYQALATWPLHTTNHRGNDTEMLTGNEEATYRKIGSKAQTPRCNPYTPPKRTRHTRPTPK